MPIVSGGGGSGGGAITQIAFSIAAATAASFDFQNVSQAFNHLRLVVQGRSDNVGGAALFGLQFNGDAAANYDYTNAITLGTAAVTAAAAAAVTAARIGAMPYTALTTATGLVDILIPNYTGTTFYKTWVGTSGRKDVDVVGNFSNETPWGSYRVAASPVTRVTVKALGTSGTAQNFVIGSSAYLYGIT